MISYRNFELYFFHIIFLIVSVSIFFIPPIITILNINFRIDDIIILTLIPIILVFLYKRVEFPIYSKILISFFISICISIIYGYLVLSVPFSMRDINELIRMLKPFFFFSFLLLFYKDSLVQISFKFLNIAMIIFIFIGLSESLKIPYLNDLFISIYSSGTQSGISRINTTTLNPNDGAILTLFFLFFSINMLLVYKKLYYFISSLSLIFILLNTGSRTAFLIAIIFFIVFFISTKTLNIKHKILCLLIMCISLIILYPYIENYINRILTLVNAVKLEDSSLNVRFNLWNEALQIFYESKIFGWGVAKAIHHTTVDGEYFIILRKYGIIGLCFLLFLMIYPLSVIKKKIRNTTLQNEEKVLLYTLFSYILAGLLVMFTNNFFTSYILIFPNIILLGILFNTNEKV